MDPHVLEMVERTAPPDVPEHVGWHWQAFWVLSRGRPTRQVSVPLPTGGALVRNEPVEIPFRDMAEYARTYGLDADDLDVLLYLLCEMDQEYLQVLRGTPPPDDQDGDGGDE